MPRDPYDKIKYYLRIAQVVSSRATCPRARCGAVIVKNDAILSTGFNGAPSKDPHCDDIGCLIVNGHCERSVHAETNAIFMAARHGVALEGATLYSLQRPCNGCLSAAHQAGIVKVYYALDYHSGAHGDSYMSERLLQVLAPEWITPETYESFIDNEPNPFSAAYEKTKDKSGKSS